MKYKTRLGFLVSASWLLLASFEISFAQIAQANCDTSGCLPSAGQERKINNFQLIAEKVCIGGDFMCINTDKTGITNDKNDTKNKNNNNNDNNDNNDAKSEFQTCVKDYLDDKEGAVSAAMDRCERQSTGIKSDFRFCVKQYISLKDKTVPEAMERCDDFYPSKKKYPNFNAYDFCVDVYQNNKDEFFSNEDSTAKKHCREFSKKKNNKNDN